MTVLRRRRPRAPTASRTEGNALLRAWAPDVSGSVLSVGSGNDRDREGRSYRDYFKRARDYTTSDVREGCDLVLDVQNMAGIEPGSFDAIFCHSVLEHVPDPWAGVRECARVLAPSGVLILGVPFFYQVHKAPRDFWRFTEFGVRLMLEAAGLTVEAILGVDGPPKQASMYWARARKA